MATKYIFLTGGVVSSLGKGITAAALGRLLKSRGLKVSMQKFDPYININPGLMSPLQQGEVFVTEDGGECNLNVGHYERFIGESLSVDSDITSGQIYQTVINKERRGDYNGGTVQVIPHITNEIKRCIFRVGRHHGSDVVITDIGGTVGDIESQPFLEAIRQIKWDVGSENCLYIHVTLVPYLEMSGELKTKPTQHSVKALRSIGIQPDIICCRCEMPLSQSLRDKIGLFCNIAGDAVIPNYFTDTPYEIPMMLAQEGLDDLVCKKLRIEGTERNMTDWQRLVEKFRHLEKKARIALVGKYTDLRDAYISVVEALTHAGVAHNAEVEIKWIYSGELSDLSKANEALHDVDGVIVPYGFGDRGAQGMMVAAQYAREHDIPFFALGLGTHMAVVEFARNVCGLDADSTEQNPNTPHPVVDLMVDCKNVGTGDTMRLGNYAARLKSGSLAHRIYGQEEIAERHRHRYEINPAYAAALAEHGMVVSGENPETGLPEIVEIPSRRWYLGVQFHAEFTSRLNKPHPLFRSFLEAALQTRSEQLSF